MNNRGLADTFTLFVELLEIKGEINYKTLTYRGQYAKEYWKEGKAIARDSR